MWERQGRAVKDSELGQPAKEVRKRGTKDEPVDSRAAEEEAEVREHPMLLLQKMQIFYVLSPLPLLQISLLKHKGSAALRCV